MRSTGRGTPAARNVYAKTGTVERVMSYSGYFRTRSGELMSFVLITNDYNGESSAVKKRVEKLMSLMVQLP
jgi:D-alanyl-D-alanine carboxypeptidase/D-alanyl-D-alanine-endopeptidase (penicillin-binding protein 4)